eukprot:5338863-Amphidinium_carterae.3
MLYHHPHLRQHQGYLHSPSHIVQVTELHMEFELSDSCNLNREFNHTAQGGADETLVIRTSLPHVFRHAKTDMHTRPSVGL